MTSPTLHRMPGLEPWKQYLPSKKIRWIIGGILVVGLIYALHNPIINLYKKIKYNSVIPLVTIADPSVEQSNVVLSTDKDTDGDGLLDWQETLVGSNPNVADEQIPQEVRDLVNSSNNTLIDTNDKLALRVYQRLLSDPKGGNIQEALQAATSKEIIDYADGIDRQLVTYTLNDLTLMDDTPAVRQSYQTTLNSILAKTDLSKAAGQDLYNRLITGEALKTSPSPQAIYADTANKLRTLPVPVRMADLHLSLLNAVAHMSAILAKPSAPDDQATQYSYLLVFQKNYNLAIELSTGLTKSLSLMTSSS